MAGTTTAQQTIVYRLTLREVIKNLGWFPLLFATVVGAPSILSILEMALDFRLVGSFQWIVDGYNQLTAIMARLVEPLVLPVIAWINELFGWRLKLYPHWRPMFLLMAILLLPLAPKQIPSFRKLLATLTFLLPAMAGAILAGLVPIDGPWYFQGLIVIAPIAGIWAFALFGVLISGSPEKWRVALSFVGLAVAMCLIGATIAMLASLIPGLSRGAGIATLAGQIILSSVNFLRECLKPKEYIPAQEFANEWRRNAQAAESSLRTLGGFMMAGVILAIDLLLKSLA
jgi:hypothetical protein